MQDKDIRVGHYYRRRDGGIRYVEEILSNGMVGGKSREPHEQDWPGRVVSPLDIFAALSECECDEWGNLVGDE